MAKERKPSIYVDRGTIGSHDELDEYGVWVKSEPQDLAFTGTDSREIVEDFEDFSEDIFEEASGTDDLDLEVSDMDDLPDFGSTPEEDSLDFSMEKSTDLAEDDFGLPEIGDDYGENLSGSETLETIDFDELEDFSTQKDAGFDETVGFDEDAGFDQTIGLDETTSFDEDAGFDQAIGFDETTGFDEDTGFDQAVGFDDAIGFDKDTTLDEAVGFDEETVNFEDSAVSLDLPDELPLEDFDEHTEAAPQASEDEEFIEIILDDIIEESVEIQDTDSDLPFPAEMAGEELVDSEYPLEQVSEASSAVEAPKAPPAEQIITNDASSMTLSTQLLMKIAEELSSIRSELSNLKKDFSSANPASSSPLPAADEDEKIALTGDELSTILSTESDSLDEEEQGFFNEEDDEKIALTGDELNTILSTESDSLPEEEGFLHKEEEDDEKIALTGDELSNILNTADFTEETGADATELSEDSDIQETEDPVEDFSEPAAGDETDLELLEEQDSSELVDLETEFAPLDMDISLEEADLEELELEYTKGEESQFEDTSFSDIAADIPAEEPEELSVFDITSDSVEPAESEDSVDLMETIELMEVSDIEISLDEESISLEEEAALDSPVEEDFPDFAVDEIEDLSEIQESGAEPIAYAPDVEDSIYLAEDPLSIEEPIDLSEAVIDEPDLSSELQDNPIEEPSLEDISIDLDFEEDISIPENVLEEVEVLDEEIELSIDITEDIAEAVSFETEDTDEDFFDAASSMRASSSASEDGGDLSLIPEGFVVDATESDSVEFDSVEADSAEMISADFPDFPEESTSPEVLEVEELEMELDTVELESLDSPEVDVQEFDTMTELDSVAEFDTDAELDTDDDIISMDDIDDFMTETEETVEEVVEIQEEPPFPAKAPEAVSVSAKVPAGTTEEIPSHLKKELKTVLSYMDQLLESLPDEKIEEFAKSEYYDTYKKLFKELGLV